MVSIIILIAIAVMAILFIKAMIIKVPSGYCYIIERYGQFHKCLMDDNKTHLINPITDKIVHKIEMSGQNLDIYETPIIMRDNATVKLKSDVLFYVVDPEQFAYCNRYPLSGLETLIINTIRMWAGNIKSTELLQVFSICPDDNCVYSDLWQAINGNTKKIGVQIVNINCSISKQVDTMI